MKVLAINCGSSSIKYQVYDVLQKTVIEKGSVTRVGQCDSLLSRSYNGKEVSQPCSITTHKEGFELIFRVLTDPKVGSLQDLSEIYAVGHRAAHGGAQFSQSMLVTDEIISQLEKNTPLAPLHNPMNILGIQIVKHLLPHAKQVAVFDTSFHHTVPLRVRVFPIPYKYFEEYGIQRYGFHGLSYRYIIPKAAKLIDRPVNELKMIVCHLGNGCTATAIDGGKSIDTSLGFSTFAGLMMGTRPGDFDPGLVFYLNRELGMSLEDIEQMLYKESGLLGISGISGDMREVQGHAAQGDQQCQLAVDMFTYRAKKTIGAYMAALGGLDALVFTGGIGEKSPEIREMICEGLEYLGIELDSKKNQTTVGEERMINSISSKVKVMVVPTNEELIIINDTIRLAGREEVPSREESNSDIRSLQS